MKKFCLAAWLIFTFAFISRAQSDRPLLLQQPTVSRSQIAFAYAGELWTVSRDGGDATRITSAPGVKSEPKFSPDGKWIAFTGDYDGNTDVYLVPSRGGEPRRLTYHPGQDHVVGWTPDGKNICFHRRATAIPHLSGCTQSHSMAYFPHSCLCPLLTKVPTPRTVRTSPTGPWLLAMAIGSATAAA